MSDAPQKLESAIQETQIPNQILQTAPNNMTGSIIGNISLTNNEPPKTIQQIKPNT